MKNTLSPNEVMTLLTSARRMWLSIPTLGEHENKVLLDTYTAFLDGVKVDRGNIQVRYDDFLYVYNIVAKPKING